jgi:chloramphenicol 3-O-phosphotransferase
MARAGGRAVAELASTVSLARGHLDTVHAHHRSYDVEISTHEASPADLARKILIA